MSVGLLSDKRLYLLIVLVCLLGVIGLSAFQIPIPPIIEQVLSFFGGIGVGGAAATRKQPPVV